MAFQATYEIVDAFGRKTRKTYQLTAADYATASTDSATLQSRLEGVITGGVIAVVLSERTPVAGVAGAGSNRDEGVTITGRKADSYLTSAKIPTPNKTAYVNSDGSVDLVDAAVVAYLSSFAAGGIAYISDGETCDNWLYGSLDS